MADAKVHIEIRKVDWQTHASELRALRTKVFIDEQKIAAADEWDDADAYASTQHFLAYCDDVPVGTVRFISSAPYQLKLTRLAVLSEFRGHGAATMLIQKACFEALCAPAQKIYLHAQARVNELYRKLGFEAEGDLFDEAGIPHQCMNLPLTKHDTLEKLFKNSIWRMGYPAGFAQHMVHMMNSSSRSLLISSQQLRDDIFATDVFISGVSAFARKDRRAHVKILVQAPNKLSRRTQRLLELARRLPTKIEIKTLKEDENHEMSSFICADSGKLTFFNDEQNLEGFCCYQAIPEVDALRETFDHSWNHLAESDPNMAKLFL